MVGGGGERWKQLENWPSTIPESLELGPTSHVPYDSVALLTDVQLFFLPVRIQVRLLAGRSSRLDLIGTLAALPFAWALRGRQPFTQAIHIPGWTRLMMNRFRSGRGRLAAASQARLE